MKYKGNRGRDRGPRRNEAIRAREVRVVDPEGKQLGVMPTQDAINIAHNLGIDLIEIANKANPPVCRLMDYGKFKYEQAKKDKESGKNKNNANKLKEVKFRVRIEQNDYMIKLRRAEKFLMEGDKVKLSLFFRKRELSNVDLGMDVVKRAITDLNHIANADNTPKFAGRNINVMLSPLPASKRKLKYSHVVGEDVEDDETESGQDS